MRRESEESECAVPLVQYQGQDITVSVAYPEEYRVPIVWDSENGILTVQMEHAYMGRILKIN